MHYLFDIAKTTLKLLLGRGSTRSFSQFGEDAVIGILMRKTKRGVYVDVGAFHPTLYSNTYALYRRGWSGITIDPSLRAQRLFKVFRPRDAFYRIGIDEEEGELSYVQFDDPAYNTLDRQQAIVWEKEGRKKMREDAISVVPLRDVIRKEKMGRIDLLSIDVEGHDLAVLRSHDWDVPTRCIIIEDHEFNPDMPAASAVYMFLKTKGYVLKGICGPSLIFESNGL